MNTNDWLGLFLICVGFAVFIPSMVGLSHRFGVWIGEKYNEYYSFGRRKNADHSCHKIFE